MKRILRTREFALCCLLALMILLVAAGWPLFPGQTRMLLWNIFLSVIPLLLSLLLLCGGKGRLHTAWRSVCLPVWLFFYPNAPYMITDLIHVRNTSFRTETGAFLASRLAWTRFFHLVLAVAAGCLCGVLSLYLLHRAVRRRFGRAAGWGFVAAVSALSGVGIYLGRFVRFNTWDLVTRPLTVLGQVLEALHLHAAAFYLLFAAMTFLPYAVFYICMGGAGNPVESDAPQTR